jgi:hypothetical protein
VNDETIEMFRLELARPGPLYGQLISRLTNYMSLCDGVEADTFQLPFAHYEIEEDLQGLRYHLAAPEGAEPIPNTFRGACLDRLSNRVAQTIDQMRGFQTRFAESANAELTHLRLLLNGGELSLIPFELSAVPLGWRGSGRKLTLQSRERTVVTRELRDSSRYSLDWSRPPRVLFCTASPEGFEPPPAREHLAAIVQAVRPWVKQEELQGTVTVVEDASLEKIAAAIQDGKGDYTHVHLLAHGAKIVDRRDRYGIALVAPRSARKPDIVDARELAAALWGRHPGKKPPTLVTLASCDSANQATVVAPGSSLAHELHHEGVPWIVGSQMPLTFKGSVMLARVLYSGLFAGEEPRWVLHRLRTELAELEGVHDWASLVVYAAIPSDFEQQAHDFCIRQIRRAINAAFARAAKINEEPARGKAALAAEFNEIERLIQRWERALPAVKAKSRNDVDRSEYFGMRGSVAKQQAALVQESEQLDLLAKSACHYRQAASLQLGNHWTVVQYLSLLRVLSDAERVAAAETLRVEAGWHEIAERAALLDLDEGGTTRTWALASLLELALIAQSRRAAGKSAAEWAEEFARGLDRNSFECFSTVRQLQRYYAKDPEAGQSAKGDKGMFARWVSEPLPTDAAAAVQIIEKVAARTGG